MTIAGNRNLARVILIFALSAACCLGDLDSASAQYYYQPAPDYYHNDTATDTVVGGALGAVTGAVIGGRKDRGAGALIGAGVGAVTGNLLGRAKDSADERQAATGAAVVAQANQQAAALAVTNNDLVGMARAGVSDDLIISTMQSRGARLDLGPQSLIALKQSGVSDRVLFSAQGMNGNRGFSGPPPGIPVATIAPPPTVIVQPAPWPRYGCYPHYYPYHHHHHHGHHAHLYYNFR